MLKKQLKKVNDDYRAAKRQLDGTQFACFTRYKSTNTDAEECRVTELNHEKAVLDERTHELQVLTQDSGFITCFTGTKVQNTAAQARIGVRSSHARTAGTRVPRTQFTCFTSFSSTKSQILRRSSTRRPCPTSAHARAASTHSVLSLLAFQQVQKYKYRRRRQALAAGERGDCAHAADDRSLAQKYRC
jgi:hypothetical protein